MQARGFVTTAIKIDPYISVDAGTMNPTEHGEVLFWTMVTSVIRIWAASERFLGVNLSRVNYMTTGRGVSGSYRRERARNMVVKMCGWCPMCHSRPFAGLKKPVAKLRPMWWWLKWKYCR